MPGIGSNQNNVRSLDYHLKKKRLVSLDKWIEFRNLSTIYLEHDYPDELRRCFKRFQKVYQIALHYMEEVVIKVFKFARRYNENIRLP